MFLELYTRSAQFVCPNNNVELSCDGEHNYDTGSHKCWVGSYRIRLSSRNLTVAQGWMDTATLLLYMNNIFHDTTTH